MVSIAAVANDRFYIEDFTINPGETKQIALILQNDTVYSAIQADLYLPEGLAIEQEDGDYIFDLTDRKARNHTVSGNLLADGGIRVLIGSQTSKTISGNDGPLVVFNVTADDSFSGTNHIEIKNIIAAEANTTLHYCEDEDCVVSIEGGGEEPTSLQLNIDMARLKLNHTLQLSVVSDNSGDITWTSSNPQVASVDTNGVVTALRNGTAAITATDSQGNSTWCAVWSYLRGDLNEDGVVDVSDVNIDINIILGRDE